MTIASRGLASMHMHMATHGHVSSSYSCMYSIAKGDIQIPSRHNPSP